MPAKNVIKPYVENGYYHLYNRGAEKLPIFLKRYDYLNFIYFLKKYIAPEFKYNPATSLFQPMNMSDDIDLLCFCLMPNHYHFLVKQKTKFAITDFTRRLLSSYAGYFNQKYGHGGGLFQSKLKGILIESESYLLHLSRYIHRNPKDLPGYKKNLSNYPYSSYQYYLSPTPGVSWVKTAEILSYFKTAQKTGISDALSYQDFVESYNIDSDEILGNFSLDEPSQSPEIT